MSQTTRQVTGQSAEEATQEYLCSLKWRILDTNWRKPWGELDIVALDEEGTVHVVEVKASTTATAGFEPYLRAGKTKLTKVHRTAHTWLSSHGYPYDTPWQIDIASATGTSSGGWAIELFENV
jgi:putative endonuclease